MLHSRTEFLCDSHDSDLLQGFVDVFDMNEDWTERNRICDWSKHHI